MYLCLWLDDCMCVYVCGYECVCVYVYGYECVCIYVYGYECVYIYVCGQKCVSLSVARNGFCVSVYVCAFVSAFMVSWKISSSYSLKIAIAPDIQIANSPLVFATSLVYSF